MSKGESNLNNSADEKRLSELMRKSQSGDTKSYQLLLFEVEKMMSSYVQNNFSRLGISDSAASEDVVQEILIGLHSKRATYDPQQFFLPWIYAIARYKVIDHARAQKTVSKYIELAVDIAEHEVNGSQLGVDESSAHTDLQSLFTGLPRKQRQILELVKVQGLTIPEAAIQTGFSQSDIKVSIHRAIKFLQKKIMWRNF